MSKKKNAIKINTNIEIDISKTINNQGSLISFKKNYCEHVCDSIPLIMKTFKFKMLDDFLLGDEHVIKVSPGFLTPISNKKSISSEEKKNIVLNDPKFGMFSLFKYHLRRGYLNNELKKTNKVFCSHIFSLILALPILVFVSQWILYISLMQDEIKNFDGKICPNKSSLENKMIMSGIGIIYFVRSFFIWDNLTSRIGLIKMNRLDTITAILDTFQEFLFNIIVYSANLWIIFAEDDIQNMLLNSLAMEFLMKLDNEFEELYFEYLPGSAEDIYDNIYVDYDKNKKLIKKRKKKSCCFNLITGLLFLPYKLLVITIFLFPLICFSVTIIGPICK